MLITYFAGAADAAGTSTTLLDEGDLTAAQLVRRLGGGDSALEKVLSCCSLLVDGAPVRDASQRIPAAARVDVLPPFAGG